MDPVGIVLSERSLTDEGKYYMIFLLYGNYQSPKHMKTEGTVALAGALGRCS